MQFPRSRSIRVHGRAPVVVVAVLLAALVSPTWPAGASGSPVAPVPVGVWPLRPTPVVVRAFEAPAGPFGAGHRGVDLAGAVGQRVRAALGGRITYAAPLAGRGVVVVDHGETRTTYEPVSASVRVGDRVLAGQAVGTLELSGSHCFPRACLHWGWIRGDTYLDPLLLVGAGPVRLLPLWVRAPSAPHWQPPPQPFAGLIGPVGVRPRRHLALLPVVRGPTLVLALLVARRSWARPLLL
jgi:murein DD-endopeptidase MepM/ murein hydrolase activator NlpD